ncbi:MULTISPECIES: glutaredoxin 2 [unclassified Gilliamella]|uniref:glutaredoxin 2 n=1 Tax=unclassified Gilliamella TaxID=2685620 RepID=UPI00226A8DCA|nr:MULTISPECIES: glutaredoxin 2 [unclassified Gilliamella]MCX8602043.1 glutaredoxin 2 [Gilliamella sp. B3722]MCX8608338.1 glutaredoxin 2 [Gilliamella sp. B3771]MCX8611313.1 glutaredoxin 2 [Gilliamella sp. B3891]MCX8613885.1 glutaredoxin 2 [Gilliamella sp. B3773]MCX8616325.1 glutaredoxin 2 [Gilliamella sp. B3770]
MKLYIYEHCPFCVRARMIFGLKHIPVEQHVLLSDDFKTPEKMIGKKMAPILQKADGSYMPESLDIVEYIDNNNGKPILTGTKSPQIADLIKQLQQYDYKLEIPRYIKLGLAEFATQSAIDYFINSKVAKIGSIDECLAQSEKLILAVSEILNQFDAVIVSQNACNGELSLDDICLFPVLRNLTCVKGLTFPPKIKAYLLSMAADSGVDLFFDRAI